MCADRRGPARTIGAGTYVGSAGTVTGIGRFVDGPATVLKLMCEDVSNLILIVREAAATGIAPILPDSRGVVCTSGGPTSHLALVSKEYGIACVMAAKLDCDPESLSGVAISIDPDGSISRAD